MQRSVERILSKQILFEKTHFLHLHAQKSNKKQRKSFIFRQKKSKKIQSFYFSKNASRMLLMASNEFLSTPRNPKHLLEAPQTPQTHFKKFLRKSIFQLENPFFKLGSSQSLKKRIFEQYSQNKIFLNTLFHVQSRQEAKEYDLMQRSVERIFD